MIDYNLRNKYQQFIWQQNELAISKCYVGRYDTIDTRAPLVGGIIKMLGCDGGDTLNPDKKHTDLKKLTNDMEGVGDRLKELGPGWELVNCNRRSNYVKFT